MSFSTPRSFVLRHAVSVTLGLMLAASLAACGGGGSSSTSTSGAGSGSATDRSGSSAAPCRPTTDLAAASVQPNFHRMPLTVMPDDTDRDGRGRSASRAPAHVFTPKDYQGLSTRRLTDDDVEKFRKNHGLNRSSSATPLATSTASVVYTPAQIRAAYHIPGRSAADQGAGQTVYIVNAYSHPEVVQDLNTFSAKFGLPGCTQVDIATTATALPAASTSACQISVVNASANGCMTSSAPAYNAGWAQESALDTQWVHAVAPLARIVLIQSASASISDLGGAITLANKFGAGAVSMSFSVSEDFWVTSPAYSSALFGTAGMSYFAATGDTGYSVGWPAVSPTVVGVGGSSLSALSTDTSTSRTETAWSGSGGGISGYWSMPAYQQQNYVSIIGNSAYRTVSDVAMNADPYTGVYVAFTPAGASSASWYTFGGTSLATPMWAATVAIANAKRAAKAKGTLDAPHAPLYALLSGSSYATHFNDINTGVNGACAACAATSNYDIPTGLGTPNVSALVTTLAAY